MKAARKVILENNSIVLTKRRHSLALRRLSSAYGEHPFLLKLDDHLLGHQ
jgi:uncharacterized protein (DUF1778 family)